MIRIANRTLSNTAPWSLKLRSAVFVLLAMFGASAAAAGQSWGANFLDQRSSEQGSQEQDASNLSLAAEEPVIRSEVNLVLNDVSVRDKKGAVVGGLTAENFEIREDGKPQRVAYFHAGTSAVSLVLVVDRSGSMRPRWGAASEAIRQFMNSLTPDDEVALIAFNETVEVLAGLGPLPEARRRWPALLEENQPGGQTSLYDAVIAASELLHQAHQDRRVVVVISDGKDTTSERQLNDALAAMNSSNQILYSIGIFSPGDRDADAGTLRKLAENSGGLAMFPQGLESLAAELDHVMDDLRTRYLVGYYADVSDGGRRKERKIDIAVKSGKQRWKVRARKRYRVPL